MKKNNWKKLLYKIINIPQLHLLSIYGMKNIGKKNCMLLKINNDGK